MLHFVKSYMNQNKKNVIKLYGLEIIFKHNLISLKTPVYGTNVTFCQLIDLFLLFIDIPLEVLVGWT